MDVDLSKKEILKNRVDLNQNDSGWCCSFAVADAIRVKSNIPVSAIDIAIMYANKSGDLDGCGNLESVVRAANEVGFCEDSNYRSNYKPQASLDDYLQNRIHPDLYKEISQVDKANLLFTSQITKYVDIANSRCPMEESKVFLKNTFFKNINEISQVIDTAVKSKKKSDIELLHDLALKNCTKRTKLNDLRVSQYFFNTTPADEPKIANLEKSFVQIKSNLEKGRVSVLSIDTNTIFKSDQPKSVWNKFLDTLNGNHAVSVLGSMSLNGKCYFKIRDSSFGKLCHTRKISDEIQCNLDETQTYLISESKLKLIVKSGIFVE